MTLSGHSDSIETIIIVNFTYFHPNHLVPWESWLIRSPHTRKIPSSSLGGTIFLDSRISFYQMVKKMVFPAL